MRKQEKWDERNTAKEFKVVKGSSERSEGRAELRQLVIMGKRRMMLSGQSAGLTRLARARCESWQDAPSVNRLDESPGSL